MAEAHDLQRVLRLRRLAIRYGLRLHRSPYRRSSGGGNARWWIVSDETGHSVAGHLQGLSLDAVEAYLTQFRDEHVTR